MLYLLVASVRNEVDNKLLVCHCNVGETLEKTTEYLFSIFDDSLRMMQKAQDEQNEYETVYHDIDDPNYVDYVRKTNGFMLPYVALRDKVRKKIPLKKSDFDGITIFGVGKENGMCIYLSIYEIDSFERAYDIVEVTIDMLGYWDEYLPKLKEAKGSNELFNYLYEACKRFNNGQ